MPDQQSGPSTPSAVHDVARELLGVLPFGLSAAAFARCPRLTELTEGRPAAVVEAIDSLDRPPAVVGHAEPVAAEVARHMLHVLLASRDMGWPGQDSPLGVRRVAAADLFFDATQAVLADHEWKGPHGVEFALLTALAERICRTAARRATARAAEVRARDVGVERLGHLHRVHRPRAL